MARYTCARCGAMENTLNEPHLCPDVAKRLKRRTRQRDAVMDILIAHGGLVSRCDAEAAEAIVKKLSALGVEDD